jgi:hypothetical protein
LTLQHRANSKNQPAQYSWEALNHILQNVNGSSLNYEAFKSDYDSDETIKNIIKNFDANGLTIKTHNREDDQPVGDKGENDVNKMAKRATAKAIG